MGDVQRVAFFINKEIMLMNIRYICECITSYLTIGCQIHLLVLSTLGEEVGHGIDIPLNNSFAKTSTLLPDCNIFKLGL